ncbi:MAG: M1 family metallopeptidase [Saprospiraceae bacterium]|nr:M1 family metallopeptidase [Saprospiraceae bacterium]
MVARRSILYTIILLFLFNHLNAQEKDGITLFQPQERSNHINTRAGSSAKTIHYDVKYQRLELEADPAVHYLTGIVTTYFIPVGQDLDVIYFDFKDNMTVDSVFFRGIKLASESINFTSSTELEITLGSTVSQGSLDSLSIFYQGAPISGDFGIFKTATTSCTQPDSMIWTLSEPYGSKGWWPCKETLNDKADSIDIIITTPSKYRAGSNGLLVGERVEGSKKVYHWRHRYPIPAYLVAFAVADYAIYSDTIDNPLGGEIEVLNYVFKCDSTSAASQTPDMDPMMKYFINTFGQYPYVNEKYGHAQCGFGGGMEHSTMSFMGNFSKLLMAHELAHQWFGNKITCGSWHEIWLNEGFATYLEGLTCEQGFGQRTWDGWKTAHINYVTNDTGGSVYNPDTTTLGRIFSSRWSYSKGALLLHMLRWKMGDIAFFDAVYNYINDPQLEYSYAHTDDLKAHLEAEYGESLTEFFNDWYYGEGWPDYVVNWSADPSCNALTVNIQQSHSTGRSTFFEMPLPIAFSDGISDTIVVFHQESPDDTIFYSDLGFIPTSADFDPDQWLCAKNTVLEVAPPSQVTLWRGETNNDWHNPSNWSCGIPDMNQIVTIPKGTPECIIRNGQAVTCKSLIVEDGATIKVEEGSTLNVTQELLQE